MIKNKIKSIKGISLVSLSISIAVILVITSIIIYNIKDNLQLNELQKLQNDVENLRDKISNYYLQYGAIPAKIRYNNIDQIDKSGVISDAVDTGDFFVIDLQAIDNLTLNYGRDYEKIKDYSKDANVDKFTDLYIINEASHNIFYVDGVEVYGNVYYTDYLSDEVDVKAVDLKTIN